MNFDITNISQLILELSIEYLPKVALAILTFIIGSWIIKRISRLLAKFLEQSDVEVSLSSFLQSLVSIFLKIMLLFTVASMFGIDTTSFIAILGALTVGIGMALNGSIGHLASGVMILLFKPFKVGDLVEVAGGSMGTVDSINAFNTSLTTLDNKKIIIANSNITSNIITNISGQGTVGVEMVFGIGYDDNIDEARKIILEVGQECPWVIDLPKHTVVVGELADSSVNLATRPFCKSEHYWQTKFYMLEHVKKAFDQADIGIPFPQLDVHVNKSLVAQN